MTFKTLTKWIKYRYLITYLLLISLIQVRRAELQSFTGLVCLVPLMRLVDMNDFCHLMYPSSESYLPTIPRFFFPFRAIQKRRRIGESTREMRGIKTVPTSTLVLQWVAFTRRHTAQMEGRMLMICRKEACFAQRTVAPSLALRNR